MAAAAQRREPDEEEEKEEENDEGLDAFFARHEPPPFPLPTFNDEPPDEPAIELRQDSRSALGGRVWRASLFLLRWLHHRHGPAALAGTAVLDVGAGIGVLGLACAGARPPPRVVVLTDQDCLLELLEENAGRVRAGLAGTAEECVGSCSIHVRRLDWLERGQGPDAAAVAAAAGPDGFDWVLVADCVYYQHLFAPLVATLAALASEASMRVVICNDDGRTSAAGVEAVTGERWDAEFFRLLGGEFEWDEVQDEEVYPVGGALGLEGGPYRVVVCRRRTKTQEKEGS